MIDELVHACDLSAFTPDQRARHRELLAKLLAAQTARTDLPSGSEMRIDRDAMPLGELGEWIDLESRCCPFLDFRLELAAGASTIALQLTSRQPAPTA